MLFPGAGVSSDGTCHHRVGILWKNFKAHSRIPVKVFRKPDDFLDVEIMGGRLTPEGQPLDKAINKVFKGYFRDLYDLYSLTAPLNSKTGAPIAPTRKILSTWILKAWEKVPEYLVRKSWTACVYIPEYKINASNEDAIITYSAAKVGNLVGKLCGENYCTNFEDEVAVGPDPFPSSDDEGDDDNEEMFSEFD